MGTGWGGGLVERGKALGVEDVGNGRSSLGFHVLKIGVDARQRGKGSTLRVTVQRRARRMQQSGKIIRGTDDKSQN